MPYSSRKFINAILKESQINFIKKLEKEQTKPKSSRRKEGNYTGLGLR